VERDRFFLNKEQKEKPPDLEGKSRSHKVEEEGEGRNTEREKLIVELVVRMERKVSRNCTVLKCFHVTVFS
jgi:hypothetical protein